MAMAEKEEKENSDTAWGTLEELLLACAICRYGTQSWDSVASAVQKRASTCKVSTIGNSFSKAFTPTDCQQRYRALNYRFHVTGAAANDDAGKSDGENYVFSERELPLKLRSMIEELKRLRVQELRREVERHDVSIKSLQSKVKRLEEERGRSSLKAEEAADLGTGVDWSDVGVENRGRERQDGSTAADKPISGEATDEPEDRSLNESNSTSQNAPLARMKKSNRIQKPKISAKAEPEPDPVPAALDSKPNKKFSVVGRASQSVKPGGLRSSVSESNREAKEIESSDVQSSANLSVTKRRGRRRSNETEVEKPSPAKSKVNVKPQPLIKFLEIVRSHKHGLVFQRRLPSQKTLKYKNMIRQHMDIETIESKLERGVYYESHPAFYRDLLLVFTNALIFFCKSSTEHLAARELRKLVSNEIAARKPSPSNSNPHPATCTKKPRSFPDIVVCRRRRNNSNNNTSSVKTEEPESTSGGLKAEPGSGKDMPMKLKRGRTSSNSAGDDTSSSVMSNKRRKEGATEFVERINRDSTAMASKEEETSKKKMKTEETPPLKGRVSGRRSVSTTSNKNPRR